MATQKRTTTTKRTAKPVAIATPKRFAPRVSHGGKYAVYVIRHQWLADGIPMPRNADTIRALRNAACSDASDSTIAAWAKLGHPTESWNVGQKSDRNPLGSGVPTPARVAPLHVDTATADDRKSHMDRVVHAIAELNGIDDAAARRHIDAMAASLRPNAAKSAK